MNWGGIIAGALGGGAQAAGAMASDQIDKTNKLDLAKQMSDIDEARQMRVAEASQRLARTTHQQTLQDTEDFAQRNIANQVGRAVKIKKAEGEVELEQAGAKADLETKKLIERASNQEYLKSIKAIALANRAPPSALEAAQAEAARFHLENEKAILKARQDIASGDPAKVESGKRTLAALVLGTRSDADVVGAAKVWEGLAKAASAELESTDFMTMKEGPEKEARKAEIMARVREANQSARDILSGMATNRGLVNGATPAVPANRPPLSSFGPAQPPAAGASAPGAAPGAAPAAGGASTYVPPADSVVGKYRAEVAKREQELAANKAQKAQQASEAFAAAQGDKVAAARLQASDLFSFLQPEQQKAIYNLVNGVKP